MYSCDRVGTHVFDVLRQDLNWSTIITSSPSNSSFFFEFRSCVLRHRSYGWQPSPYNWGVGFIWNDGKHLALYTVSKHARPQATLSPLSMFPVLCGSIDFRSLSPSLSQPVSENALSKDKLLGIYLFVIDIGVWYTWMEITLIGVYKTWNVLLNKTASVIFKQGVF